MSPRAFRPCDVRSVPTLAVRSVFAPVVSGNSKWFSRHTSQGVCPWNDKFSRAATEDAFALRPEVVAPDLAAFATMSDAECKVRFDDTPLSRAKRAGLVRSVAANRDSRAR
jgi:epoxyqueuosine reductase